MHDPREEDKAFIDTLDVDAQLIMKGKGIASLEALRNKIGWQDDDIVDQVFRGVDITRLQAPVSDSNQELTLPTCSVPELRLNGLTRPEVIKPWLHAPEVAVAPTRIRPFGMRR